jgi:dephospho-CoA kinase
MKILLTGSFKSGKTTLADLLRNKGIPVIEELCW